MPVEEHPLYAEWRLALERVTTTKAARSNAAAGTPAGTATESEYQMALAAYELSIRKV